MTDRAFYNMNAALLADEIRSKLRFMKKIGCASMAERPCAARPISLPLNPFHFVFYIPETVAGNDGII